MPEVKVINVHAALQDHSEPTGSYVYIGRTPRFGGPSILHNRWSHKTYANAIHVETPEQSIGEFRAFLWACLQDTWHDAQEALAVRKEFGRLVKIARKEPLTVGCHRKPGPCHGDIVAKAIEWYIEKNQIMCE